MSGTGTNFISDKFRKFCSKLNIEQAVSSAYHHQSNRQVEACNKFIKHTLKNAKPGNIAISITADEYIHYQVIKHANRQTDPLDDILEQIKDNPMLYSNRTFQSNINNTQSTHDKHQPKSNMPERGQEHIQTTITNTRGDNNKIQQGENCVQTRYGRTIRKPDRLSYQ